MADSIPKDKWRAVDFTSASNRSTDTESSASQDSEANRSANGDQTKSLEQSQSSGSDDADLHNSQDTASRHCDDGQQRDSDNDEQRDSDNDEQRDSDNDEQRDSDNDEQRDSDNDEQRDSDNDEQRDSDNDEQRDSDNDEQRDSDNDEQRDSDNGRQRDSDDSKLSRTFDERPASSLQHVDASKALKDLKQGKNKDTTQIRPSAERIVQALAPIGDVRMVSIPCLRSEKTPFFSEAPTEPRKSSSLAQACNYLITNVFFMLAALAGGIYLLTSGEIGDDSYTVGYAMTSFLFVASSLFAAMSCLIIYDKYHVPAQPSMKPLEIVVLK